ncbi:hypothetical protein GQ457_05G021470 [Hibiscus cannabinus]
MNAVMHASMVAGAFNAVTCTHHAHGGKGAVELGVAVQRACESVNQPLHYLYPLDIISIKEKIEAIARSYGASGVEYSNRLKNRLRCTPDKGFLVYRSAWQKHIRPCTFFEIYPWIMTQSDLVPRTVRSVFFDIFRLLVQVHFRFLDLGDSVLEAHL